MRTLAVLSVACAPALASAERAYVDDRPVPARVEGAALAGARLRTALRVRIEVGEHVVLLPEARCELVGSEGLHAVELAPGIAASACRFRLLALPHGCLCTDFSGVGEPWSAQGVAAAEWRALDRLAVAASVVYDVRALRVAAVRARPSDRWRLALVFPLHATAGLADSPGREKLRGCMSRILLIDDDSSLLDVLSMSFEDAGHEVRSAPDGTRGLDLIRSWKPNAVVSDVNMPGLDGFSLCRRLRADGNPVPVVLLTSRDNEIDEALGLELGADDYVAKPFSTRVLLARISALLRRDELRSGGSTSRPALVRDGLSLDSERLEVRYRETPLVVTVTEFRLLECLVARPGIVQSRKRLLDLVRADGSVVAERIIDTYVRRLRRKLETVDPAFDRIETVVGAGYRWKDSV